MQGISPVLVFRSLALAAALALTACGGSDDEAASSEAATSDNTTTTAVMEADVDTGDSSPDTTAEDVVETSLGDSGDDGGTEESTEESTDGDGEPADSTPGDNVDEVATLCAAYLESISFGTVDQGLATLREILGPDAPIGVQAALDTLQNPDGDIEGFFSAQNSLDGYVLPICREEFSTSIVPLADDSAAADAFVGAVRDGDLATAESLAPTNVIVSFDWNGFPDATWEYSADNGTVSMLLEPTVTVFCQISGGAVEACAFGE